MSRYAVKIRDLSARAELRLAAYLDEIDEYLEEYLSIPNDSEEKKDKRRFIIAFIIAALMLLGVSYFDAVTTAGKIVYEVDEALVSAKRADFQRILRSILGRVEIDIATVLDAAPNAVRDTFGSAVSKVARAGTIAGGISVESAASGDVPKSELIERAVILASNEAYTPGKYIYIHLAHMEGICSVCAPFVGRITDGTGADGVPPPPQHRHCRCALVPYVGQMEVEFDPISELRKLPPEKLEKIIGPVRMNLLRTKKLTLDDLFTEDYSRLKTLAELGYNRAGVPL
ncbi:MAG: hypothetical protein ACP5QX_06665 [Caldisericaceae bacterium]